MRLASNRQLLFYAPAMSYTFAEKQQMKTGGVTTLVSSVFYAGIAWGITKLIDGGRAKFFWTLGILVGLRAAYSLLEFIIGIIVWRIYCRSRSVANFVAIMRNGNLPKRVYCTDQISDYLARIQSPLFVYKDGIVTAEIKKLALELDAVLSTVRDQHGMMAEMRTWDAMKRALEIHSPGEDSPQFVSAYVLHWLRSDVKEAEIQILPNATPSLAKRIIAERPFETLTDLYQLLRNHGLDRMQAVVFLNGASTASADGMRSAYKPLPRSHE